MEEKTSLKRLSEVMQESKKPAIYAREFMKAAEEKKFRGVIILAERIQLKPNKKGGKLREIQDFAIIDSQDFRHWHEQYIRREDSLKGLPSFEEIKEGSLDQERLEKLTEEFLAKRRKRSQQTLDSIKRKKTRNTDEALEVEKTED